jgi:predicted HAD superfamily phosphohydrolase YqeG
MIRLRAEGRSRASSLARIPRLEVRVLEEVWPQVRALEPAALLIDIEPFVAAWRTDEPALLRGLRERLAECATIVSLREVVFVTNSGRSPRDGVPGASFPVSYISAARKPFLDLSRFASLGSPVVVIGDQAVTDGLMAWRLNAIFVQVPLPDRCSVGVRAQSLLGRMISAFVFRPLGRAGASSVEARR